jgi:hypothetical protein
MRRETAAFVCSHVFQNTRPVLLVARENGDWMYLCGKPHAPDEEFQVVGAEHLLQRDPSLADILDLQDNCEAERPHASAVWSRMPLTHE